MIINNKEKRCQNLPKNLNKLGANNNSTGFLTVEVHDRISNIPITFADVRVYFLNIRGLYGEAGDANLIIRHVTDEEGKIPLIELPIIDRRIYPRAQYYMTVNHFRYHPVNLMNIQVYPNITTSYNVLMTPLTSNSTDYEFIINPDIL